MNYLVTLNIGNVLTDNARESMLAAAKRWGCGFREITENFVGDQNLCFNKYHGIIDLAEKVYLDSVMYVDADILIRDDTPNPFCCFTEPTRVYGVLDAPHAPDKDVWRDDVIGEHLRKVHERLRLSEDFDRMEKEADFWFVNAGCFIANPGAFKFIRQFICAMSDDHVARIEQAMWNYILKSNDVLSFMPMKWNRVQPDVSTGKMQDYVYHFTGPRDHAKLKALVATYDWHV